MTSLLSGYVPRYGHFGQYGGGGIAGLFQGLGIGLSEFAKMQQQEDLENKKLGAQTAQEAARQAYEMNLNRFREGEQNTRQEKMIAAENQRADAANTRIDTEHKDTNARLDQQHQDTVHFQNAELGLRERSDVRADSREQRHQEADDARTTKAEGQQKLAMAHADLADMNSQRNALHSDYKDAVKEYELAAKTSNDPAEIDKAKLAAQEAKSKLDSFDGSVDSRRRQDLAAIGRPDKSIPSDIAAKGPDYQAAWQAGINAGKDPVELQQKLEAIPPEQLQQKMGPAANGATSDTDTGGAAAGVADTAAQSDDFMPTSGAAPTAVASAAPSAPSPTAPDQPQATAEQAPQPSVADTGQSPPEQAPAAPDFSQLSSTLGQSAGGQAVTATLQRLAEQPSGPGADKMRRAAEIGLQNLGVDPDTATAYIDNYTSSNSGGSPDLDNMYNGDQGDQTQQAA
jgi:hypothetical protein